MGAGKSSAARAAARVLGDDYVDTDDLIAAEIPGGSISGFFREQGEARFRELEERIVLEALERPGAVVALGGGAVESERVRAALAGHVTAWCRVDEGVAWERTRGTDRPLARDRDGFRRRHSARLPLYEQSGRVVLPTGGEQAGAAVAPWLDLLRGTPTAHVLVADAVRRSAGARRLRRDEAARGGAGRAPARRAAVRPRRPRCLRRRRRADARDRGGRSDRGRRRRGGEDPRRGGALLRRLAGAGVRREDALLAFGGGVAGDLVGFCAAVYQRGVPVVQVPTTLVAQVDSAYGGKTGVDLPEGKNYVGAFHQPAVVLTDPAALRTLPAAEIAAGFAEVVKTALIAGGPLWERVRTLDAIDAGSLAPLVFECARTKLDIVDADERESGLRAVLNLGHTVGHGIEAATGYSRYRHGEAISIGLVAALRLSGAHELEQEVGELLMRAGLPVALDPGIDTDSVLDAIGRDKKRTAEGIGFVTISGPGAVEFGQRIDADSLRRVVDELASR